MLGRRTREMKIGIGWGVPSVGPDESLSLLPGRFDPSPRGRGTTAICAFETWSDVSCRRQAEWGGLGDFRRKAFLIGLGLAGLLELLFHGLEGRCEHGGG